MSIKSIIIQKEEIRYAAADIASGTASQGKTTKESMKNPKKAIFLYYKDNTP